MGFEFMSDEDLRKIVGAAILLDEQGIEPTEEVIEVISDGDEDIPVLIQAVAEMRSSKSFGDTLEDGVHFLQIERGLDEEQFDAPYDVRERVIELLKQAAWSFKNNGHGPFDPSWIRWHKVTGAQCRAIHYAIGAMIEAMVERELGGQES